MRIVIHVGPHKTGTTSIQRVLLRTYGSSDPVGHIWYPTPTAAGPGHTALAQNAVLANGSDLGDVVTAASKANVSSLILSSEAFDAAYPQRLDRVARHLQGHEVRLVVTLNAPAARFASSWQERIKHGVTDSLHESAHHIFSLPGYQPDFSSAYAEALAPTEIAIVISSRRDPADLLIQNAMKAMELPASAPTKSNVRLNTRLGYVEAELLRTVNALTPSHISPEGAKQIRRKLRSEIFTSSWHEVCPRVPITAPFAVRTHLNELARATVRSIEQLRSQGAYIYGDPANLVDSRDEIAEDVTEALLERHCSA